MATKKKNSRRWLLWVLLLAIIAIIAIVVVQNNKAPKGTLVETAKTEVRTIRETVSASGRIYPVTEVIISSDVSGEIVELYVQEGDSVTKGQILVKIDPEAYVSTVERGEANLNNTRAQVATSRAQIQNGIAQKGEIETQLIQAKRVHDRNVDLFKEGVISQLQFDESLAQIETLQARLKSADANIRASEESARAAEFNVKSAEASLKELRTNLSRTTIKAPTSGIISSLVAERGERVVGTIQMTGTEIMRISDLRTMEVQVEVSENDIIKVSLNDEVEIEVDSYLDRIFKGRVTEIASSAANALKQPGQVTSLNTAQVTNFIIKIGIDPESYEDIINANNRFPFRPGMSASVDIITDIKENIIVAPIQSVTVRAEEDENDKRKKAEFKEVIFAYQADTAAKFFVKTGIQDDDYIEIVEGMSSDVEVVSGPYATLARELKAGELIRRKPEKDKAKNKK